MLFTNQYLYISVKIQCIYNSEYIYMYKCGSPITLYGKLFIFHLIFRLDYCGIALLTIGSFVPWLYYSFYYRLEPKVTYLALIIFLGTICIVVSMWDKFAQPQYRPLRAGEQKKISQHIQSMNIITNCNLDLSFSFYLINFEFFMLIGLFYQIFLQEYLWPWV